MPAREGRPASYRLPAPAFVIVRCAGWSGQSEVAQKVRRESQPKLLGPVIARYLGIEDDPVASVFSLRPGYPNPFASDTRLQLTLPTGERVVARVYSTAGRLVKTLVDGSLPAGEHFVPWDGTDERGNRVASGVYFVRLEAGTDRAARKVVLLR